MSQKILLSAHVFESRVFKAVFVVLNYGWTLLRPKWVSFLEEMLS